MYAGNSRKESVLIHVLHFFFDFFAGRCSSASTSSSAVRLALLLFFFGLASSGGSSRPSAIISTKFHSSSAMSFRFRMFWNFPRMCVRMSKMACARSSYVYSRST